MIVPQSFTDNLSALAGGYDVVLHLVLAVALAGAGFWAMWFAPAPAAQRAAQPRAAA